MKPRSRHRWIRLFVTLLLLAPLAGCGESVFDVRDFGTIRYDLTSSGTPPSESASFHIDYQHLEIDDATGGEPFTPRFLPRTMENVPAGRLRVMLTQKPESCSVVDDTRVMDLPVNGVVDVTFEVECG